MGGIGVPLRATLWDVGPQSPFRGAAAVLTMSAFRTPLKFGFWRIAAVDLRASRHIVPKCRGGGHGLINGLLKHFACNMRRGSYPPTGCDRVWHAVVLERLYSPAATERWRLEMQKPETFVVGRQEKA